MLKEVDLDGLLFQLSQKKILRRLLGCVLVPVNAVFDEDKLEEMMKVAGKLEAEAKIDVAIDFFFVNKKYFDKLKSMMRRNPMTRP